MPSEGARQSPRGLSAPAVETFGPLGIADRLNWLNAKKRRRKTSSQRAIVARSYWLRLSGGKPIGSPWPAAQPAVSPPAQLVVGVPFVASTTQVLPGFSGSGLPAVVRSVVPAFSFGRDQVPSMRLPWRKTNTLPEPTV